MKEKKSKFEFYDNSNRELQIFSVLLTFFFIKVLLMFLK